MRVCHLTSVHSSKDTRIFYKECVSLASAGYEVFLIAIGASRIEKGVNVVGIGRQQRSRIARIIYSSKRVYRKSLDIDADIYHIHDPELLPYALKLKKKGKLVIFDSHENILEYMDSKTYIPRYLRQITSFLFKKYATYILSKIDGIISVTPSFCDKFKSINSNTILITNYPIINNINTLHECNWTERNFGQLCFTGGISNQWNIDRILDIIEQIPYTSLILCGNFDSPDYKLLLENKPAWSRCKYLGNISQDKVKFIQQSSNIGLCILQYSKNTNFKEGTLGNTKLFEYLAAGTPVICTDFNIWKQIINKYKCGIAISPNNTTELFNAVRYMLSHPTECRNMGQNGKAAIINEFNWGTQVEILLKFYKHLTCDYENC